MTTTDARRLPPLAWLLIALFTQNLLARNGRRRGARAGRLGGAVLAASLGLLGWSVATFRRHDTTVDPIDPAKAARLVTDGPFRVTRNPMYVAMTGALLANAAARRSVPALLPAAGFAALMDATQIEFEERAMQVRFGAEWDRYSSETPRWLGRVATQVFERSTVISAAPDRVWERVTTPEGINDEMRPWMTMTMPRRARGLNIDTLPLNTVLGRAWIRLFGLVPLDYDALSIIKLEPGRHFHEKSTMASMRRWEHQRTLTPLDDGTTRVTDRITFEPRIPGVGAVFARVLPAFFSHRHRRLARHFALQG